MNSMPLHRAGAFLWAGAEVVPATSLLIGSGIGCNRMMRCQHELHEHDELGFRALPLGKNSAALDLSPGRLDGGSTSAP